MTDNEEFDDELWQDCVNDSADRITTELALSSEDYGAFATSVGATWATFKWVVETAPSKIAGIGLLTQVLNGVVSSIEEEED